MLPTRRAEMLVVTEAMMNVRFSLLKSREDIVRIIGVFTSDPACSITLHLSSTRLACSGLDRRRPQSVSISGHQSQRQSQRLSRTQQCQPPPVLYFETTSVSPYLVLYCNCSTQTPKPERNPRGSFPASRKFSAFQIHTAFHKR